MAVEVCAAFGATASIVTLVQAGNKSIKRINDFKNKVNNVPECYRQIDNTLHVLRKRFEQAPREANSSSSSSRGDEVLSIISDCVKQVWKLEVILGEIVPQNGDGTSQRTKKALKSLWREKEVQKITRALDGYIKCLTYEIVSVNLRHNFDKENIKYRKWLSPPDPFLDYREALRHRLFGTGFWFLNNDRYRLWKSSGSCLWLQGFAGCGKTVLTSTIVENLRYECDNDPSKSLAFFYFSSQDVQKGRPEPMLRSIICQLSRHIYKPRYLVDIYHDCQLDQRQPSENELMEILYEIMHIRSREDKTMYIVIDAVDECSELSKLETIIRSLLDFPQLRLLLTSRKEQYLEDLMADRMEDHDVFQLSKEEASDDIQRFVHYQLLHNKCLETWGRDPAIMQEIEIALKVGSRGMFRWALCQLEKIKKCRNISQLRDLLESLPHTLDKTSDRIADNVRKEDSTYVGWILQWLAFLLWGAQ